MDEVYHPVFEAVQHENSFSTNPTAIVDLDFKHYLQSRDRDLSSHKVGGIPDYAFSLDRELRQQIMAMAPVRAIALSLVGLPA